MKAGCLLLCLLLLSNPIYADDTGDFEARGVVYASTGKVDHQRLSLLTGRLIFTHDTENIHTEAHLLAQQSFSSDIKVQEQRLDRLNISYSNENINITLGRQAVSLATTFFFSPNDFFSPFDALSFNRDFKQGVDALGVAYQIGDLAQLSALYVQHQQANTSPSSVIKYDAVGSGIFDDLNYMLFAANINDLPNRQQTIIGGSIQSDLFNNIGLRAEGNIRQHNSTSIAEWVVGLEYRWQSELQITAEWFHHGSATPSPQLPYQGKSYLAVGWSYPFTPLLQGYVNSIINTDDASMLQTAQLIYSLSNESTLQAYLLLPAGKSTSEFAYYPKYSGLEYQLYF